MADYKWGENPYKTYPPRGVNGTDIVENPDTNPVLIGHTMAWCNDLEAAFNEAVQLGEQHKTEKEMYYNRLVELKDIIPPKTAEQIAQEQLDIAMAKIEEQSKTIEQNTQVMTLLMQKLENIGGVANGNDGTGNSATHEIQPKSKGNSGKKSTNDEASTGIGE